MRKFGAHIGRSQGLVKVLDVAQNFQMRAIQMFGGPPQRLSPSKELPEEIDAWWKHPCRPLVDVYIHLPYVMNLAVDNWKARGAAEAIFDFMLYAEKIGALGVVLHCGSAKEGTVADGWKNMKQWLRWITGKYRENSPRGKVKILLENQAGGGTQIAGNLTVMALEMHNFGKTFPDLSAHVGVCLDTAHAYAAGYNLNKEEDFEQVLDFVNRWADLVHLNDVPSKVVCGRHLDRHAVLTTGSIGQACELLFRMMNDGIPVVAEREDSLFPQDMVVLREWSDPIGTKVSSLDADINSGRICPGGALGKDD